MHYRCLTVPELYAPESITPHPNVTTKDVSRHCYITPEEAKYLLIETIALQVLKDPTSTPAHTHTYLCKVEYMKAYVSPHSLNTFIYWVIALDFIWRKISVT